MTQLTVTGPFVNKTLFEQAGVAMPGDKATWDDWAKAAKAVADKVKAPFPIAIDRSGHRFLGMAISEGAKLFDAKGDPAIIDDGFKRAVEKVVGWHASGVMSKELWASVSGTTYRGANDEFKNAQVVLYMSGSWQIAQFDKTIGNAFDWVVVPNPCGAGGCTGMPGGAALVAIKSSKNPQAVAKVMEYLASEEVLSEFYSRTLFVPGHVGLSAKGIDYPTASPLAKAALDGVRQGSRLDFAIGLPVAGLCLQPHHVQRRDQPRRSGGCGRSKTGRSLQADRGRHHPADRRAQEVRSECKAIKYKATIKRVTV